MHEEKACQLFGGDVVCRGDEDTLFGKAVDNDEDGCETGGLGKLFDEVHGDGVPWAFRDRKLLETAVGLVTAGLVTPTDNAGLYVLPNETSEVRPVVFSRDDLESLVLTGMTGEWVVVLVAKNANAERVGSWDVDAVLVK